MYTQAAISRADVAAIFLSRKILLDTRGKDSMLLPSQAAATLKDALNTGADWRRSEQ